MAAKNTKHRIGIIAMIMLPVIALVFDLLGLIPFVKDFLGTLFWLGAAVYFHQMGMGWFNGKKLGVALASWIIGLIPVLQELPIELTAGIIAIIIMIKIEERTGVSVTNLSSAVSKNLAAGSPKINIKGTRQASGGSNPLHTVDESGKGVRLPSGGLDATS